jgi:hypothetical protein
MSLRRLHLLLMLVPMVTGAAAPSAAPREFIDEQSANTLMVVAAPLVFARERSDIAAHARDYATVVAVEVDASGQYSPYVLVYRWSTVDTRMSAPPDPDQGALRIIADGRTIDLAPLPRMPFSLGPARELHVPNHGAVVAHAYKVDVGTLNFIALSHDIVLRLPQESLDIAFRLREDGRGALRSFVAGAAAQ